MKKNLRRGLLILASLFFLSLPGQSIHAQKDITSFSTEDDNKIEGVPDYGTCAEGDFNCMNDRNESIQTADFITQSFMSLDADTAEQEMEQDYVKYYWNSSMTLMGDYLDLFRPSTILMSVFNLITTLFEMIGLVITTFVMILYNITSTSFISSIMDTVLTALDQLIFQWNDPDSWAYKVIILGAFVSFAVKLLSSKQKVLSPSHLINLLFQVIVSASLIVVIGIYGRPIVNYIDKMFNDLIVVVIDSESDLPLEIENKSILFDTLQMQSFKIRHFGSLDIKDASYEDEDGELVYVSADERLNTLLRDQTWESAWTEYDSYGNNAITHNIGSSIQVLFLSIIFLIHRVMLAIIYITLCALLGIVKLLKELTIVLSLYQLIYLLFKGNSDNRRWLMDRLQWMILCMMGNVLFTTLLFFMSRMIESVSLIHPLALIGFDILLLIIIQSLPHFISPMMKSMIKTMTPQVIGEIVSGRSSPKDVFYDLERNFDPKKEDKKNDNEKQKYPSLPLSGTSNEQELADHALDSYEEDPAKQLNDLFKDAPNATTEVSDSKLNASSTKEKIPSLDEIKSKETVYQKEPEDVSEATARNNKTDFMNENKKESDSHDHLQNNQSSESFPISAPQKEIVENEKNENKQISTIPEDELADHPATLTVAPLDSKQSMKTDVQEDLSDHATTSLHELADPSADQNQQEEKPLPLTEEAEDSLEQNMKNLEEEDPGQPQNELNEITPNLSIESPEEISHLETMNSENITDEKEVSKPVNETTENGG